MRVGVRCSNLLCRKLTTGPRTESPHIINIGVAAHITAASPGGPRYDLSLSSQQRESPENGIWLCQNCGKLIDNDPARYPAEVLREWKAKAEASALAGLEGRAALQPDLSAEIELYYEKNRITGERHDYSLRVKLTNRGTEPFGAYHIDLVMPALVVIQPRSTAVVRPRKQHSRYRLFPSFISQHRRTNLSGRHQARDLYTLLRGSQNLRGTPPWLNDPSQSCRPL